MPEKNFRAGIFDVNDDEQLPLATAIDRVRQLPLGHRLREEEPKIHRLERCESAPGVYRVNFASLGFAGPGRAHRTHHIRSFDFDSDEYFAHETAMLYDVESRLAFIELTRDGISARAIARYFSAFASDDNDASNAPHYELLLRLDPEASMRAARFRRIRSVIMRVAIGPATTVDRDDGIGIMESLARRYGADYTHIEIKVDRRKDRSLQLNVVREMISRIIQGDSDERIKQMKIAGRERDDDELTLIDLLHHTEKREQLLSIDPNDRRVPCEARWRALENIRSRYQDDLS